MTEADFEQQIVDLAHVFGWHVVGHRTMRTKHGYATGWKYDGVGWPDLTLIHESGSIIFAEIKTATGRLSPEQTEWGRRLSECRDGLLSEGTIPGLICYDIWRPADSDAIILALSFGRATEWTI